MEWIQRIGSVLGYIATAIGLFTVIKSGILKKAKQYVEETACTEESDKIHHELEERMNSIEDKFSEFLDRDTKFKENMGEHIKTQQLVDRKVMADIIERLYYQNRDHQTLDDNEFRRLTEVYEIYHNSPVNGNSYISELYHTMLTWERVH
jgi:hypothetical protein